MRCILAATIASCAVQSARANAQAHAPDAAPLGIWLEPEPTEVEPMVGDVVGEGASRSPTRVSVSLLAQGRTPLRHSIPLLEPPSTGETEAFGALMDALASAGIAREVHADLLHWQARAGTPPPALVRRPDIVELNRQGDCGAAPSIGRYVSPCHPDVHAALVQLATEAGRQMQADTRLTARCRLSPTEMLAFSDAQRERSILCVGLDPLDVPLRAVAGGYGAYGAQWWEWRLTVLTGVLARFVAAYRAEHAGGTVSAAVLAGTYRDPLWQRAYAAEDWLTWILDDLIDGVLLEGAWEEGSEDRDYASALGIIAKTGKEIEIGVMLRAPSKEGDTPLARQQEIVLAQGRAPDYWMIEVNDEPGLKAAQEFLAAQPAPQPAGNQ
ncbi:MAG: hypothetical protein FJX74_15580 [Armatimonadetes bacterium]|nr:hypothetical protein [Armatimonadota bacterium]